MCWKSGQISEGWGEEIAMCAWIFDTAQQMQMREIESICDNRERAYYKVSSAQKRSWKGCGSFWLSSLWRGRSEMALQFEPEGYVMQTPVGLWTRNIPTGFARPKSGIAIKKWVETLRWPTDMDQADPYDWGISWFEMTISFYLFSGMLFPIRISGAGARSKYVEYHSNEATLLPPTKRSGAQQALCFRNVMQNLSTLLGERFFPSFKESKCSSMYRLGWRNECAGITRRPILPNNRQRWLSFNFIFRNLVGWELWLHRFFKRNFHHNWNLSTLLKMTFRHGTKNTWHIWRRRDVGINS